MSADPQQRLFKIIDERRGDLVDRVRIENLEWAQWLDQVYARHDFDMSIVGHAEPLDYDIYARDDYYFGYSNPEFKALIAALDDSVEPSRRKDLLQRIQRKLSLDAVFVSHDLHVIRALADRVYVMQKGRIVEEGPTETVFAAPRHAYTQALMAGSRLGDAQKQFLERADSRFHQASEKSESQLKALLQPVEATLKRYEEGLSKVEKERVGSYEALREAQGKKPAVQEVLPSGPVPAGKIRIPNLTGVPARQALKQMIELGLVPHIKGSGLIVAQQPPPGSVVDGKSEVLLVLEPAS